MSIAVSPAHTFMVQETTIADVHAAFKVGELTARQLVETYLERIDAFDKNGPVINSLIAINPRAVVADGDGQHAGQVPGL